MIAEVPGIALALSLPERLGIADALRSGKSAGLNPFDPLAMVASSQTVKLQSTVTGCVSLVERI